MAPDGVHAQERGFYDARAAGLDPAAMPPRPLDGYERSILEALGPVESREVLEVGCGEGDLTLELLARGARVTALDLSEGMLAVARARAGRFAPGGTASFIAAPVEATGLPASAFDRVVGKWILHHSDVPAAAREMARVLRGGGYAVFFENHDRNPILRFARRRLLGLPGVARVGTAEEHPLTAADLATLRGAFTGVELRFPSLYFLEVLSRQVLRHRLQRPLHRLDALLWRRVPRLRPWSYHVLVVLRHAGER